MQALVITTVVRWEIIIPKNIGMPIWQLQKQRDYCLKYPMQEICFNEKLPKYLKDLPNLFGIAHHVLVTGYDNDRKDLDEML